RRLLEAVAADLRLAREAGEGARGPGKRLHVTSVLGRLPDPVYARALAHAWQLAWRVGEAGDESVLSVWKGIAIPPVGTATRTPDGGRRRRLARAARRAVIGCHLALDEFPLDVDATREAISRSPDVSFVFIDAAAARGSRGPALVAGLENAVYTRSEKFGEP